MLADPALGSARSTRAVWAPRSGATREAHIHRVEMGE